VIYPENPHDAHEMKNPLDQLELPSYRGAESRSCVMGLLENDPDKRLGSPNSPHGNIRDHPFFKKGRKINWSEIDEELFKSFQGTPKVNFKRVHTKRFVLFLGRTCTIQYVTPSTIVIINVRPW